MDKIITKNFNKYNDGKINNDIAVINSLIFNDNNHIVSSFKDLLVMNETQEFLSKIYSFFDSFQILTILCLEHKFTIYYPNIIFIIENPNLFSDFKHFFHNQHSHCIHSHIQPIFQKDMQTNINLLNQSSVLAPSDNTLRLDSDKDKVIKGCKDFAEIDDFFCFNNNDKHINDKDINISKDNDFNKDNQTLFKFKYINNTSKRKKHNNKYYTEINKSNSNINNYKKYKCLSSNQSIFLKNLQYSIGNTDICNTVPNEEKKLKNKHKHKHTNSQDVTNKHKPIKQITHHQRIKSSILPNKNQINNNDLLINRHISKNIVDKIRKLNEIHKN